MTKFNPAGNALVYSTYLGTLATCPPAPCPITQATAVAVDATGNAYVTGRTQAHDFPTHAAYQPLFGGGPFDIFVAKLTPDGSALVYSTYLGGNETDQATGIAVDAAGSAYVTGCNALGNFPTQNPYQSSNRANATCTGILTKFTPDGSGLIYSTYFGGTGQDTPLGIAVDSSGNAYIAGSTSSTDLPTKNPIQPTNLGVLTGFVTEFNPSGSALVYSTYLGGSSAGQVNAIAVDGNDNTYVVGQTQAADFPTHNAFQATNTGNGFVSVLAPGGTSFIYSTYVPALPTALAVDGNGDAYFAGANNPAVPLPTQNPIQATSHVARNNTVGTNAFVAEFNPCRQRLALFHLPRRQRQRHCQRHCRGREREYICRGERALPRLPHTERATTERRRRRRWLHRQDQPAHPQRRAHHHRLRTKRYVDLVGGQGGLLRRQRRVERRRSHQRHPGGLAHRRRDRHLHIDLSGRRQHQRFCVGDADGDGEFESAADGDDRRESRQHRGGPERHLDVVFRPRHGLHRQRRVERQRSSQRHAERDSQCRWHQHLYVDLHGCGRQRECFSHLDGNRSASCADGYDRRESRERRGGPERHLDVVFHSRHGLHCQRRVERQRSGQRHAERESRRRRHQHLYVDMHGCGRQRERERGVDGDGRHGVRPLKWRRGRPGSAQPDRTRISRRAACSTPPLSIPNDGHARSKTKRRLSHEPATQE